MIVDERITAYINSLSLEEIPFLEELEQTALKNRVPIIRKETQSLLKMLVQMKCPTQILEIGTAVGFSALLMSEYVDPACKITTIENYEKRIPIARENFQKAGKEEQITLLPGDAMELLKGLSGPYDFMFLDAAKAQYIYYLPELLRCAGRRNSGNGQCIAGWKYSTVPVCSREKRPHYSCQNEGVSVYHYPL